MAHDFFTSQVGLSLYFGGSQSPRLKGGMEVLESLATRLSDRRSGARVASILAGSVARPFFRLVKDTMKQTHKADPQQALAIADTARQTFEQSTDPALNIPHRRLAEQRSSCWKQMGEQQRADEEIYAMHETLAKRGVHPSVLHEIMSGAGTTPQTSPRKPKRKKKAATKAKKKKSSKTAPKKTSKKSRRSR
jgi:hypothetical protein